MTIAQAVVQVSRMENLPSAIPCSRIPEMMVTSSASKIWWIRKKHVIALRGRLHDLHVLLQLPSQHFRALHDVRPDLALGRQFGFDGFKELLPELGDLVLEDIDKKVFFAREVVIERAFSHVKRPGDVVHGGFRKAKLLDDWCRSLNDCFFLGVVRLAFHKNLAIQSTKTVYVFD